MILTLHAFFTLLKYWMHIDYTKEKIRRFTITSVEENHS